MPATAPVTSAERWRARFFTNAFFPWTTTAATAVHAAVLAVIACGGRALNGTGFGGSCPRYGQWLAATRDFVAGTGDCKDEPLVHVVSLYIVIIASLWRRDPLHSLWVARRIPKPRSGWGITGSLQGNMKTRPTRHERRDWPTAAEGPRFVSGQQPARYS